jgi:hypothetical protein
MDPRPPVGRTPPPPAPQPKEAASKPVVRRTPEPPKGNRTFSKWLVVSSIVSLTLMTAYGIFAAHPDTASIVGQYGMWMMGLITVYMAVGQLDYRTAKGVPSLMDILTLLVTKGRGRAGDL